MDKSMTDPASRTTLERRSDFELAVSRTFDAPAHILFEAWSKADLFRQWWVPKSYGMSLLACEMDVRVGGGYRLEFAYPASDQPMAFYGRYIEVVPNARIVWTNDESADGAITTVTFDEQDGKTLLVVSNRFATKQALEDEIASGATNGLGETLDQLEAVVMALANP